MRPRWQRRTKRDVYTVDVTAFLSLMVILVPFLLITAVFTQTSILELQPTAEDGAATTAAQSLQLQVTVRDTVIEVNHRGLEQTVQIDRSSDSSALVTLATLAVDLKAPLSTKPGGDPAAGTAGSLRPVNKGAGQLTYSPGTARRYRAPGAALSP